jgi:hypothetical protein
MKHSLTFYLFCFLLISLSACRKDSYFEDRETIISPPTVFYLISVSGIVTDNDNNEPLQGAEVYIGDLRMVTDKNGAYLFRNIRVLEDVTVINIKANGYESRTHMFLPEKGKWLRQDFKLNQKQHTASFTNAEGITLELEKQAQIEIPANAIQLFTGAPYSGEVRILAEFLDPANAEQMVQSPGLFLTGNGLADKKSILAHGVLHVRMETPAGVKLKLKPDHTAKFRAPVLNALLQQSDPGASVWYLDESKGNWKSGPSIQRNGSFFEINITELSWITYGKSIDCAWLSGNFATNTNLVFNQSLVEIKVGEFYKNMISPGADGRFRFLVPLHNSVKLSLKSSDNTVIYSRSFNSLTSDTTEMGALKVVPLDNQVTVTGSFIFCPEKNHTAYLQIETSNGKTVLFPNAQNVFSGIIDNCSDSDQLKISIVNSTMGKVSSEVILPGQKLHYDLGQIALCDENYILPSYAYVSIGTKTYFSTITEASLKKIEDINLHEYELGVSSVLNNQEMQIKFTMLDLQEGYSLNPKCEFTISGPGIQIMTCNLPFTGCDLQLIVSDYHGPGSILKGSFEGVVPPGIEFKGGFNIRVVEKR